MKKRGEKKKGETRRGRREKGITRKGWRRGRRGKKRKNNVGELAGTWGMCVWGGGENGGREGEGRGVGDVFFQGDLPSVTPT